MSKSADSEPDEPIENGGRAAQRKPRRRRRAHGEAKSSAMRSSEYRARQRVGAACYSPRLDHATLWRFDEHGVLKAEESADKAKVSRAIEHIIARYLAVLDLLKDSDTRDAAVDELRALLNMK